MKASPKRKYKYIFMHHNILYSLDYSLYNIVLLMLAGYKL